jgi:hypothetical protein
VRKKSITFFLSALFLFVFIINYINNNSHANNTKSRDFEYNTWKEITKNTNFFDPINSRDFLIARNQNDAYEYNAATFYKYTGKRLAYFFKTEIIYPEISNCELSPSCILENPKKISIEKLRNLNRIKNPTIKDMEVDWVVNNLLSSEIELSSVWATDLVRLNDHAIFTYLVKFDDISESAVVDLSTFRALLITNSNIEFKPSFANQCLAKSRTIQSESTTDYSISQWSFDEKTSKKFLENRELIDYKETKVGTC